MKPIDEMLDDLFDDLDDDDLVILKDADDPQYIIFILACCDSSYLSYNPPW